MTSTISHQAIIACLLVASSTALSVLPPQSPHSPLSPPAVFIEHTSNAPTLRDSFLSSSSWLHAVDIETKKFPKNTNTAAPAIKPSLPAFTIPAAGYRPDARPALAGKDAQKPGYVPSNCNKPTTAAFPKATLCPPDE